MSRSPGPTSAWRNVLFCGTLFTSRETGVLAALGIDRVVVVRRPRVGIISTGDELRSPGDTLPVGCVYDSNATVLADCVREIGGEPVPFGIVPDDREKLSSVFARAVAECDAVLLSGGTSKGEGDVSYRVVAEFGPPGIVAHGVALKPGKPLCGRVAKSPRDLAGPSGFYPAVFTFHEPMAAVAGAGGQPLRPRHGSRNCDLVQLRTRSDRVRARDFGSEFQGDALRIDIRRQLNSPPFPWRARVLYGIGRADAVRHDSAMREHLQPARGEVRLLGARIRPADLVAIGSHCTGLDYLIGRLRDRGFFAKVIAVGSSAGLEAAKREECDLAGIHLLDPDTEEYNRPFLNESLELIPGYRRRQGIVFRPGDERFKDKSVAEAIASALADPNCVLVNRNAGSGTRVLVDRLLAGARPPVSCRRHTALSRDCSGSRDWGVAIEPVSRLQDLGSWPSAMNRRLFPGRDSRSAESFPAALRFVSE